MRPADIHILVVDDEYSVRDSLSTWFEKDGYTVSVAANGADALHQMHSQAFDVVLCDMMMPEVSGMDLHEWLVEQAPSLAGRLISITGGAFTPRAQVYLERVDNLRLEKPFDPASLKQVVDDLVQGQRVGTTGDEGLEGPCASR